MSYLVIARKWRPQNFEEIVGQEHITRVLKNAISLGRVAHAYLFSGPRGVGKTTTARVLSKALNCINGPTPEPCSQCTNCVEIAKGISLDVLEIDGASNRGIEQVRDLRENAKLKPVKAPFKIYIIDEVHMLTEPAFNALLKTLEEPPEHVKFIFATTQPHKVPLTILSRCQRFDFRPLSQEIIVKKLVQILDSEKIRYSSNAVAVIAQAARGSLRDAESLLDQFICISQGKDINIDSVNQFLGTIKTEILIELAQALINSDDKGVLLQLDVVISQGKEVTQILESLFKYFRSLLMLRVFYPHKSLESLPEDFSDRMAEQARQLSKEEFLFILELFNDLQENMKYSSFPRIVLEIGLLKICQRTKYQILNYEIESIKEDRNRIAEKKTLNPSINNISQEVKDKIIVEPGEKFKNNNSLEDIEKIWPQIIKLLEEKKMSLASYLSQSKIISLEGNILKIQVEAASNFHSEFLEERENKKLLEGIIYEKLNERIRVKFENNMQLEENKRNKMQEILKNPKLKKLSLLLNAKVLKVISNNEN